MAAARVGPAPGAARPPLGAELRRHADLALLVALAGAVGSLARWGVGLALPAAPGAPAWSTVLVNVSGAAAMGVLVVWLGARRPGSRRLRPVLGAGLLGGWTTFSAAVLDLQTQLADGRWAAAAAVVVVGLVLPVLAAWAAVALARAAFGGPPPTDEPPTDDVGAR